MQYFTSSRRAFFILAIFLSFVSFHTASAATLIPYGTAINTDTIWTKANSPYVVNPMGVVSGVTLTIEPGVVIKFRTGTGIGIGGHLVVGTLGGEPVTITSENDDSVGGDTNNDGTTTPPTPGDWGHIVFYTDSTGDFNNTHIRYGGLAWNYGYVEEGQIKNVGGVVNIRGGSLTDNRGMSIYGLSGTTTVRETAFARSTRVGMYMTGGSLTIGNDTFGNISGDAVHLRGTMNFSDEGGNSSTDGTIAAIGFEYMSLSGVNVLHPDALSNHVAGGFGVNPGASLRLLPGVIIKSDTTANIGVLGTLIAGDANSDTPVTFTSWHDDSVGGDSNSDGNATIPHGGDWDYIQALPGGTITAHNTLLRYGGGVSNHIATSIIRNDGGTITLASTTILNSQFVGIQQNAGTTTLIHSIVDVPQYDLIQTGGAVFATTSVFRSLMHGLFVSGGTLTVTQSVIGLMPGYAVYNPTPTPVSAVNNYWGDPSGPTAGDNPGGVGASAVGNVLYRPFLTTDPTVTPPDPCLGVTNCYSSVLFLPGVEASRLYRPDYSGGEDQLWEPNTKSDLSDLYLDNDGKSIRDDVYTKDVIDEANIVFPRPNVYLSLKADLLKWKVQDKIIADYVIAPYDWRLSLDDILNSGNQLSNGKIYYSGTNAATATPYIIQELKRLAHNSRTKKVTIIAHSNGGLVAKALINKLGNDAGVLIDKVVFVAVPQLGTPQAIGALLHGYDQGIPKDWLPTFLDPATARAFASTSPMAYHLLPSSAYFNSEGITTRTPPVTFEDGAMTQQFINKYGHAIGNYAELHDFLTGAEGRTAPEFSDIVNPSILKPNLLLYSESLHQLLDDNWTPPTSIKIYQIAGFGNETLATIHYWTGSKCIGYIGGYCSNFAPELEYTPEKVVDGDGTVIMTSALAMSTSSQSVSRWWVDLDTYNNSIISGSILRLDIKHADILEVPELRQFIKEDLLTNESNLLPTYIHDLIPFAKSAKRLRFILHSPLSLSLKDRSGHELSESTTTVQGGHFERLGEVQYISVPASSTPTLILRGLATGSFTLEIQENEGNSIVASTTFVGMPTATGTIVSMSFPTGHIADASALAIDYDNNGTIDLLFSPKLNDVITPLKQKIPLVLAASNRTVILGSAVPQLTGILFGFVNGDTASSSVVGSPYCITTATAYSPVGSYPIICSIGSLTSSKYEFSTFATGTLNIVYKWSGFTQPINDIVYNPTLAYSVFKGGRTIPVKFQLKNASGTSVQSSLAPLWLTPQKGNAMSSAVDESVFSQPSSFGTAFRYDTTTQ